MLKILTLRRYTIIIERKLRYRFRPIFCFESNRCGDLLIIGSAEEAPLLGVVSTSGWPKGRVPEAELPLPLLPKNENSLTS